MRYLSTLWFVVFLWIPQNSYSQDYDYYRLNAIGTGNVVRHNVELLVGNIYQRLNDHRYDVQLKDDFRKVYKIIKPLEAPERWISVSEAEWRYKKARKLYKKSVRKFNKRLKKK